MAREKIRVECVWCHAQQILVFDRGDDDAIRAVAAEETQVFETRSAPSPVEHILRVQPPASGVRYTLAKKCSREHCAAVVQLHIVDGRFERVGLQPRHIRARDRLAVAFVEVEDRKGDIGIGTAFHLGAGWWGTARHVVEDTKILRIATTEQPYDTRRLNPTMLAERRHKPGEGKVTRGPFLHPDPHVDVAALQVEGIDAPWIPLNNEFDSWLGSDHVLETAVVMGYPRVPLSEGEPVLVCVSAEVNAIVNMRPPWKHPQFILSAMSRGGFSGAPVISPLGYVIGVTSQSLLESDEHDPRERVRAELGYFAAINVQAILDCLTHHRILPGTQLPAMYSRYP